jgi:succinate dehydrogenase flavin-adding protein (antitoxin of CptAB toxin-antitoxin module)
MTKDEAIYHKYLAGAKLEARLRGMLETADLAGEYFTREMMVKMVRDELDVYISEVSGITQGQLLLADGTTL